MGWGEEKNPSEEGDEGKHTGNATRKSSIAEPEMGKEHPQKKEYTT